VIEIVDGQIKLFAVWVALMLTYLLGDVLRIFSGDLKPGEIGGMKVTQGKWPGIATIMLIPVAMVVLSCRSRTRRIAGQTLLSPASFYTQSNRISHLPFCV